MWNKQAANYIEQFEKEEEPKLEFVELKKLSTEFLTYHEVNQGLDKIRTILEWR